LLAGLPSERREGCPREGEISIPRKRRSAERFVNLGGVEGTGTGRRGKSFLSGCGAGSYVGVTKRRVRGVGEEKGRQEMAARAQSLAALLGGLGETGDGLGQGQALILKTRARCLSA